ncbi:MAG: Sigma 54 modulation protein / ribosomal protein [Burkholderiaceae bacterium]|nr:Sigma 54 modulation protein / ribosomal protein [Burkholderiaceae bacterium]
MTPTIIAKGIDASQALRDYIRDSVDSALDWTQDSIHFVTVRITDLNGPKGGKDKRCQIHLKLPGLPNVVVSEVSSSINSAIDRAVLRTSRVVSRVLARAKEIQPVNVPVLRRVAI